MTRTLEIRHQISMNDDGTFFVRETFGGQPPISWNVSDRETADELVAQRRDMLLKMVSEISDEAAEAVRDGRFIDNLKAGNA